MKTISILAGMAVAIAGFALMFASRANGEPLKVGDAAPEVTGITETGAKLNLGDVYKKQTYTLVYFYPRAGTPGCTAQGCSLRDAYEALTAKGVAVIGVSTDSVDKQEEFKEAQHFPFTLIADPDKTVITAFGVPTHNRPVIGEYATRQAYLIKDGRIVWADYKAPTKTQADEVLKVIAAQNG